MDGSPSFTTKDFTTADEFINYLSPLGPVFGGEYFPGNTLYRGHADSRWPLLPTALRTTSQLAIGEWTTSANNTNLDQIRDEARLLREFLRIADDNGLPIPEDSHRLRNVLDSFCGIFKGFPEALALRSGELKWPPEELFSFIALAQHHRQPTRFLDWTRRAYVAAYFAASAATTWLFRPRARERNGASHLCVWTLPRALFDAATLFGRLQGPGAIAMVATPAAGNPNLRAQNAMFLVYRPTLIDPDALVDRRPWNIQLAESHTFTDLKEILVQVRLPIEEAPRLLRLLAFQGVNAATMFPGFDGVAAALSERRYWESGEDFHKRRVTTGHNPSGAV